MTQKKTISLSSKTPSKTSDWVVDGRRSLHYSGTFAGIFPDWLRSILSGAVLRIPFSEPAV